MAKKKKRDFPRRYNVCVISRKFPIVARAAENSFLWPIARGIADKGHKVTVLTTESPQKVPRLESDGVIVYFLSEEGHNNRGLGFTRAVEQKFLELHEREPFDIVHSVDSSALRVLRRKKELQVALALDVKATQMAQLFSIVGMAQETLRSLLRAAIAVSYKYLRTYLGTDRKLLKKADGVIVTSPRQRLVLERYYFYPDAKIHTVPYGVEIGDLSKREKSKDLKEELAIPDGGHTIVTITDMMEIGEIRNLLYAFEKVVIKKPDTRLIIVGHGPLRKKIEFEMYSLALGNKVILTGAVSNVKISDYIALADIFVNISSRTTGFEASVIEAMAQKKVIIGSEVSALV
jgi:glycosyltransferase involved in cell wall biosynthesis